MNIQGYVKSLVDGQNLLHFNSEFPLFAVTVRAEIFAVVLFSRISRVKPSRKISTSIYVYL